MSTLKVSNIENPSTTSGGIAIDTSGHVTVDGVAYPSAGSLSGRNRIINGDMRIDQRNAGASVSATVGSSILYTVDRFFAQNLSGTTAFSVQRSTVAPDGFTNSTLITTTTSGSATAGDSKALNQFIEGFNIADFGWGTATARAITLSFWVRSSVTGSFGVGLANGAASRSYASPYSINAANTWEYKTIVIPGDTSGTWATDNTTGIRLGFNVGSGSDLHQPTNAWGASGAGRGAFSGVTSLLATNGATFYITGVQLEAGTVATPFERRSYGQELSLCQRYYYKLDGFNFAGYNVAGAGNIQTVSIPNMRATPSASFYGTLIVSNCTGGTGSGNPQGATTAIIYAVNTGTGGFQIAGSGGTGYAYTAEL